MGASRVEENEHSYTAHMSLALHIVQPKCVWDSCYDLFCAFKVYHHIQRFLPLRNLNILGGFRQADGERRGKQNTKQPRHFSPGPTTMKMLSTASTQPETCWTQCRPALTSRSTAASISRCSDYCSGRKGSIPQRQWELVWRRSLIWRAAWRRMSASTSRCADFCL